MSLPFFIGFFPSSLCCSSISTIFFAKPSWGNRPPNSKQAQPCHCTLVDISSHKADYNSCAEISSLCGVDNGIEDIFHVNAPDLPLHSYQQSLEIHVVWERESSRSFSCRSPGSLLLETRTVRTLCWLWQRSNSGPDYSSLTTWVLWLFSISGYKCSRWSWPSVVYSKCKWW